MNGTCIIGILFLSGLWGLSEAVLGQALYSRTVPYASVLLTVAGLGVLTLARRFYPQKGNATVIATLAMFYKFLNAPFFACHLLGILMTGLCYDLFFNVFKLKNHSIAAAATVYSSYTLFALTITYLFRYEHWVQAGASKIAVHIGIEGSLAALGCAVLLPLFSRLSEKLKSYSDGPPRLKFRWVPGSVVAVTIGLWILSVAAFLF